MTDPSIRQRVHGALADRAAASTDLRVTVGPRALLVELTHPSEGELAGVAHRPPGSFDSSATAVADVARLAVDGEAGSVDRAVGLATLNALSVPDIGWRVGDPMAALTADVDVIATVGLFKPAFRKFGDVSVRVVERRAVAAAELPEDVPTTVFSPDECEEAFAGADVCFITGSTLVYGGIDRYLRAVSEAEVPLTVLVGATASLFPDPLFVAGVDLMAGARVTDAPHVRERITVGDCGTDLHDAGLEKVFVSVRENFPGMRLPVRTTETRVLTDRDQTNSEL